MRVNPAMAFLLSCVWLVSDVKTVSAQFCIRGGGAVDAMADRIRAEGSFIQGVGWYNLRNAQADAIMTDSMIRWKKELRAIQTEKRELAERNEAYHKMKVEERIAFARQRESQLRTDPTPEDIFRGLALNVLLADLTDPDITSAHWKAYQVRLPEGTSVKHLVMSFMPSSSDGNTMALSRGVISLSRWELDGRWPSALMVKGLDDSKQNYEAACNRLRAHLIDGKFEIDDVTNLTQSVKRLKSDVQHVVPTAGGYQNEALRFVGELEESSHVFDARTVDYAREMLRETAEYDARTVAELVGFTLKYRLRFASVERNPAGRVLYMNLYGAMKQQMALLSASMPSTAAK